MKDTHSCGTVSIKIIPVTAWDFWWGLAVGGVWRNFLRDWRDHGTAHWRPAPVESEEAIERRRELADAILRITTEGLM